MCTYCKKPGHKQEDCRKRKADEKKGTDVKNAKQQASDDPHKDKTCAYCKKKGHVARDCPKKKSDETKKYGADGPPRKFTQSVQFASREGEYESSSADKDDLDIRYDILDINDIKAKNAPINFGQVVRQRMMKLVRKDKEPLNDLDRRPAYTVCTCEDNQIRLECSWEEMEQEVHLANADKAALVSQNICD